MKHFLTFLLFILAVSGANAQGLVDNRQQEIVIRSVNVIPMDTERVLENYDVVVKGGKITGMGATGKVKYDKAAHVVDGKGKYLIPGLAEIHAHVPPIDDIEPMKNVLILFAANGVTTIRGMLGHPRHLELRSKIQSGEILGPRFITSGPSLNGNSVKTQEAADKMVRDQKTAGYDFLKLHPGLTLENFNAIVKTSNEIGMPYAGHVSSDVGVWRAIEAKYASIDHLDGFIEGMVPGIEAMTLEDIGFFGIYVSKKADQTQIPKLIASLKKNNVWVVPTQCLAVRWAGPDMSPESLSAAPEMKYMDPKTVENWSNSKKGQLSNPKYNAAEANDYIKLRGKLIYECQKNGVGLLLGSDAPQVFNVPGFSIHHELQYLVDAGLTPYEAVKTGTVNVAKFLKSTNSGAIKTGNVSDFVLLNANPLIDIKNTKAINGVMLGNNWLSVDYISAELKKIEKK